VLGPVDPQLGQYPAASILRAVAKKPVAEIDDNTLILADQAEKALSQVRESVRELLATKLAEGKAEELARLLSDVGENDEPRRNRRVFPWNRVSYGNHASSSAICLSICRATTPSSVTCPFPTMM
jgi:hypothetical protein